MERLDYKYVEDFLHAQTGGQLAGLIAYLRVDDEVQTQRLIIAIRKAFGGGQRQQPSAPNMIDGEPVIDTTKPEFVKTFKGFTYTKPQPPRKRMPGGTQIIKAG